ncbi:hypothetical protein VZO05_02080 [Aggregatilineales bacterium SYSU G02658]
MDEQESIPPPPAELPVAPERPRLPLPNYTLSTVCPACGADTFKLACKVRCGRCGFVWDCSEL